MAQDPQQVVQLADRAVDLVRQLVVFPDGRTVTLTTREAQLLAHLARRPEVDVSRDELLDEVWEYRATHATRAVDVTMRRLRAKVEVDPADPTLLISVHGVGYRFVPPSAVAPPSPPPSPPPADPASNLRPERSAFFGRQAELAALDALVSGGDRLVCLLGPGGIGKSRLAARWAAGAETWPGGAWICSVEEHVGLDGLVAAVAAALGVRTAPGDPDPVGAVGRALAGRGRTLLVLDGMEAHAAVAGQVIGAWLAAAPALVLLVTSRQRLRLAGERLVEVGPLPPDAARALFVDRVLAAGGERPDPAAVDRLVERLDRLPLALELAAPRARVLSLDRLEARLDERFKLLAGPAREGRTLQAVLDASWDLLDEPERRALAWCGVFVGGFTLEAAEAVLGEDGDRWALDLVQGLRDKSLLSVDEGDGTGEPRFVLLESVRDYAAQRLDQRGERTEAEARHARYFLEYGESLAAGIERRGGLERLVLLAAEVDNLLAIARRATGADAVRAALVLLPVLSVRGPASTLLAVLERAEGLAEAGGDDRALASVLAARAEVCRLRGDREGARSALGRCLQRARETGTVAEVRALATLALIAGDESRVDEARAFGEQALAIARERGLRVEQGAVMGMLAAWEALGGQREDAERRYVDGIGLDDEVGNERRAAVDRTNLALLVAEDGRLDDALRHLTESLRVHRAWGNRRGVANTLIALALVRARQERLDEAIAHTSEALRLFDRDGHARLAALAEQNLASLQWGTGRAEDALPGLLRSVERTRALGDRTALAMGLSWVGAALATLGRPDEAEVALGEAAEVVLGLHSAQADGVHLLAGGFLALARARAEGASRTDPRVTAVAERARAGAGSDLIAIRFLARLLLAEVDRC